MTYHHHVRNMIMILSQPKSRRRNPWIAAGCSSGSRNYSMLPVSRPIEALSLLFRRQERLRRASSPTLDLGFDCAGAQPVIEGQQPVYSRKYINHERRLFRKPGVRGRFQNDAFVAFGVLRNGKRLRLSFELRICIIVSLPQNLSVSPLRLIQVLRR